MKYIKYIKYLLIIIIVYISISLLPNKTIDPNKLMIIVHPEDGLIWGGNELSKGSYLVICLTCNKKDTDFINIMNKMHNDYIFLDYDESTNFSEEYNILNNKLKYYLNKKDWLKIITHNQEGEYGNIPNKIISERVTTLLSNKNNLYYFSKYYLEDDFSKESIKYYQLNEEEYLNKIKYISMLKDLDYINEFKHLLPYESFQKWGDLNE